MQEVVYGGLPYLIDTSSGLVHREVGVGGGAGAGLLQLAGRWIGGRVLFTPPTTERELYTALAAYLQVCVAVGLRGRGGG